MKTSYPYKAHFEEAKRKGEMEPRFSQGDRVVICDEKAASDMQIASRTGAIVQSDADHGPEGNYQVMFDGEDLPQWGTGAPLKRA